MSTKAATPYIKFIHYLLAARSRKSRTNVIATIHGDVQNHCERCGDLFNSHEERVQSKTSNS